MLCDIKGDGIDSLELLANRWCLLDERVCIDQPYIEFRQVKDRFEFIDKNVGVRVHESCRTTFRNRIERKEKAVASLPPRPPREPSPPPAEPRRLSREVTRPRKACFVCSSNDGVEKAYNEGGLGRCEKKSAKECLDEAKKSWLQKPDSVHYDAAERYNILAIVNNDVFAADAYYHKQCYNSFVRIPTSNKFGDSDNNEIEEKVLEHFFRKVERKVIKDKDAYLLSELLEDCLEISEEFGLNESPPCLRHTYRMKDALMDRFGGKIEFSNVSKKDYVKMTLRNPLRIWSDGNSAKWMKQNKSGHHLQQNF